MMEWQRTSEVGVLVVDDDDAMRLTMVALLDSDYHVVDVADGYQALEAFGQDSSLQIVVTDLLVPEMDGKQLLRSLTRFRRPFSGVIVTGMRDYFADEQANDDTVDSVLHAVLLKPYAPDELRLAVARAKSYLEMRAAMSGAHASAKRLAQKSASK